MPYGEWLASSSGIAAGGMSSCTPSALQRAGITGLNGGARLGSPSSVRGRARAREALRSIGQENLTSPPIPRTASLGYRRKGAEPWLLTVASPSGSTADVADLELQGRGAGISTTFSSS